MKTNIIINTSFPALHYWTDAPDDFHFLSHPHRHVFHVQVKIKVSHDDRDIEFFRFKHYLDGFLGTHLHNETFPYSCEQLCRKIGEAGWGGAKIEYVSVMEDNENGAEIWFS